MENEIKNLSLSELTQIEGLSVRSQNVCEWNDLIDINSILDYYRNNRNFLKLRNCGQKSNYELLTICEKYDNIYISSKIDEKE